MDWLDATCINPQKSQGEQRDLEDLPGGIADNNLPAMSGTWVRALVLQEPEDQSALGLASHSY